MVFLALVQIPVCCRGEHGTKWGRILLPQGVTLPAGCRAVRKGNAVAQSPCTKAATQGLLKDLLLLLLYLMPTSRYWQSIWSLQNWIYRLKFLLTAISVSDPETQRSILTTAMRGLAGRLITMQNLHTVSTEIVTQCHTHDAEHTPGLKKKIMHTFFSFKQKKEMQTNIKSGTSVN